MVKIFQDLLETLKNMTVYNKLITQILIKTKITMEIKKYHQTKSNSFKLFNRTNSVNSNKFYKPFLPNFRIVYQP